MLVSRLNKTNKYSSECHWLELESYTNSPEKDFILAILNRAIKDAVGMATPFDQKDAREWLASSSDEVFSATWCFNELGVEKEIVLNALYKYYKDNNYRINIITKRVNSLI